MLSLYVYNSDGEKARLFSSRCSLYIQKNEKRIEAGRCCSDAVSFEQTVYSLNDSGLFMLKKDGDFPRIAECINSSAQYNYTVFLLEKPEDMFEAVTPLLRPSGLLPESFDEARTGRVIDEIYEDYQRITDMAGGPAYHFKIKGTDYTESFPNIYLIEVQSKKITFRTAAQCYEFYDSLDSVMREAPDYFVRIHRSYVINTNYIEKVNYQDKIILLNDGQEIFFSRNYASGLKEYMYGKLKEAGI